MLLALSGLAMFNPSLFFLTVLFGGGQWTRTIHPWIGVVLFFSFAGLFFRFFRLNLWRSEDSAWLAGVSDVLTAHEERLPEVGKYNAGQKLVFWSMSLLIIVLIVSGLIIWDQYFLAYTSIPTKRVALLVHTVAAVVIICVWVIHVYAAIWVRGTIGAMTRGAGDRRLGVASSSPLAQGAGGARRRRLEGTDRSRIGCERGLHVTRAVREVWKNAEKKPHRCGPNGNRRGRRSALRPSPRSSLAVQPPRQTLRRAGAVERHPPLPGAPV